MIDWAQKRKHLIIGDFGCGEALLSAHISEYHTVYSFDHVAINERVIATDIVSTPLEDNCLDIAIFSLALMGTNFSDYLKEAFRTLKLDGQLHIWEATNRFDNAERFAADLIHLGFKTFSVEQKDVFTHIMALKTKERIEEEPVVRFKI